MTFEANTPGIVGAAIDGLNGQVVFEKVGKGGCIAQIIPTLLDLDLASLPFILNGCDCDCSRKCLYK